MIGIDNTSERDSLSSSTSDSQTVAALQKVNTIFAVPADHSNWVIHFRRQWHQNMNTFLRVFLILTQYCEIRIIEGKIGFSLRIRSIAPKQIIF